MRAVLSAIGPQGMMAQLVAMKRVTDGPTQLSDPRANCLLRKGVIRSRKVSSALRAFKGLLFRVTPKVSLQVLGPPEGTLTYRALGLTGGHRIRLRVPVVVGRGLVGCLVGLMEACNFCTGIAINIEPAQPVVVSAPGRPSWEAYLNQHRSCPASWRLMDD